MSLVFIPFILILIVAVGRFFAGSFKARLPVSGERAGVQRRLRLIGTGILVCGLFAAAAIDYKAMKDDEAAMAAPGGDRRQFQHTFAPAETKKSELAAENIAGKEGVLGTDFREWVLSLGQGRRLAYTVAVLSTGGFLICLVLAHPRLAHPHASEIPGASKDT